MTTPTTFQVSQGLEVIPPRSGQAYAIPCEEWAALKTKASKLSSEPWLFHSAGFLFLGAAASVFISIILGTFGLPEQQHAGDIAWSVCAVTTICGTSCLYFAHKERGVQRDRASDLIAQMELIEKRYERPSP